MVAEGASVKTTRRDKLVALIWRGKGQQKRPKCSECGRPLQESGACEECDGIEDDDEN